MRCVNLIIKETRKKRNPPIYSFLKGFKKVRRIRSFVLTSRNEQVRTSRTIVSHDYPHVLHKHGNTTSSGSLIAREVDMDRKIHRRMMDARYYLENGVAHPFTTGSRARRSFRLPRLFFLLLPLLSSHSTPVFISPRSVSLPEKERERERETLGRFRGSRSAGPRERMSPKAESST